MDAPSHFIAGLPALELLGFGLRVCGLGCSKDPLTVAG